MGYLWSYEGNIERLVSNVKEKVSFRPLDILERMLRAFSCLSFLTLTISL